MSQLSTVIVDFQMILGAVFACFTSNTKCSLIKSQCDRTTSRGQIESPDTVKVVGVCRRPGWGLEASRELGKKTLPTDC